MKKTLLAATLLAATSYATAASNVTVYGVLDAGVTVSKLHGDSTKVQMSNGNWMGNRWGIKGSEDLGNGNSVFFKLEQGFSLSNGNEAKAGKAFSREAALGVTGDWGTVAFGRFGALSSDCGSYSILGGAPYTTSFQTIGSMYSAFYLTDRYDNLSFTLLRNTTASRAISCTPTVVRAMKTNGLTTSITTVPV